MNPISKYTIHQWLLHELMAINGLIMYPYCKVLPTKHEDQFFFPHLYFIFYLGRPATHLVPRREPFKGREPHVQNHCARGRTVDGSSYAPCPLTLSPSHPDGYEHLLADVQPSSGW